MLFIIFTASQYFLKDLSTELQGCLSQARSYQLGLTYTALLSSLAKHFYYESIGIRLTIFLSQLSQNYGSPLYETLQRPVTITRDPPRCRNLNAHSLCDLQQRLHNCLFLAVLGRYFHFPIMCKITLHEISVFVHFRRLFVPLLFLPHRFVI